jgi:hypothetical protein
MENAYLDIPDDELGRRERRGENGIITIKHDRHVVVATTP